VNPHTVKWNSSIQVLIEIKIIKLPNFEKCFKNLTVPPHVVDVAIPINPDAVTNGPPTSVVQSAPVVHKDVSVAHVSTVGTFLNLNWVVAPNVKYF